MTNEQPAIDLIKLRNHLEQKWKGSVCPMCKVSKFEVEERIFELRQFQGPEPDFKAPLIPVIPVTCRNCGNTVLVNAVIALGG